MFTRASLTALAIAGALAAHGLAQEPPAGAAPQPKPVSAGRGTYTEVMDRLSGEGPVAEGEAEREEEIETDRDSFTPATTVVGRGRFVLESAYTFQDNRGIKETHSFPELIMRYGVSDRLELRLGWNTEIGGSGSDVSGTDAGGDEFDEAGGGKVRREAAIIYGMKVRVTDQDRWLPRSVVILQGYTPTGGSAGASTATRFVGTFAAGWVFENRWQLDTALRYGLDSEEGDRFHQWAPSAVLRVPLGEKLAAHAEYFGIYTTGKERNSTIHYVSPGVRYLVTPDLELGVRVGWGLNDQSARFFANAGVGLRF